MASTPELVIDVTCTEKANGTGERPAREEPVSPMGRLFLERRMDCYIVCVFALAAPVDLPALRRGLEATLVRHPRFCSVQVTKKGASPKWVQTTVNLDDHVIVPGQLNLTATKSGVDADRAMEDYLSSLSTLPMDHTRPLWELHVLDFPTAEAAAALAFRVHHSLGDGVSLLSLLVACASPAADLITATRRRGPLYAMPPASSLHARFMHIVALAWHTLVDLVCFVATTCSILQDPPALFKGTTEGADLRTTTKRFVNRTLSLDDVKHVKNVMNCTVNDVLLGVTSAALSRYYFRKTAGESAKKNITVRSTLAVNQRKTPGLHTLASMMESGKDNGVKWGNKLGYMILPFHISWHDDILEYVREATKVSRRKKSSMESVFTYKCTTMLMKIFGSKAAARLCHSLVRNTTLVYSNMIGPSELVVLFGHPIVYIAPSGYGLPVALVIHYQSYMNIIKVVLAVDEARFPDVHDLLDDFVESLKLIREAA